MVDAGIEYFLHEDELLMICNGSIRRFDEVQDHNDLKAALDADPAAQTLLRKWFGDDERAVLRKFAACRYGGLNKTPDFGADEALHDYIDCPIRDTCAGNGVVCKAPVLNGGQLDNTELQLMRMLASDLKNTAIADELDMPLGSLNVTRTKLYEKLNIHTKQQLALALSDEGLL